MLTREIIVQRRKTNKYTEGRMLNSGALKLVKYITLYNSSLFNAATNNVISLLILQNLGAKLLLFSLANHGIFKDKFRGQIPVV